MTRAQVLRALGIGSSGTRAIRRLMLICLSPILVQFRDPSPACRIKINSKCLREIFSTPARKVRRGFRRVMNNPPNAQRETVS